MSPTAAPRRAVRSGARAFRLGVVVLLAGLVLLGWSVYDVGWRSPLDGVAAARAVADLRGQWSRGVDPLADRGTLAAGDPVAVVRIPALGEEELPLLVGTEEATLTGGLGWYDQTAAPGEVGNLAVAGLGQLRGPLADLVTLSAGDTVEVETRDSVHRYRLTEDPAATRAAATDTWVIQPVPGQPQVAPSAALLTLTTDAGPLHPDERTVAWAELTDTIVK
ncbi:MAG: sortase domain-bontaining protein [Propioniciclava sp.]